MAWIGVTTNAGVNLMAKWTNGTILNISNAVSGSGTVPEVALLAQTSLVNQKQTVSIISSQAQNDTQKIKIQIQASEESYTLNQIGLYASLDSGTPVLLALFQNSAGVLIPSASESPDFLYTFYAFLKVSNHGEFTINVDSSALVGYGVMQDYVKEAIKLHNQDKNAHDEIIKAVQEQMQKLFYVISNSEPENGPILWFDTSTTQPNDKMLLLELGGEEDVDLTQISAFIDEKGYPVMNANINVAQEKDTYDVEII